MSFDVFFQGYEAGEPTNTGKAAMMALLGPLVRERDFGFVQIHTSDGQADVYIDDGGMMVNHVAGSEAWEIMVEGAKAANWVIMPVGCPTYLTREEQRAELPPELADDVVLVESGDDLEDAMDR